MTPCPYCGAPLLPVHADFMAETEDPRVFCGRCGIERPDAERTPTQRAVLAPTKDEQVRASMEKLARWMRP